MKINVDGVDLIVKQTVTDLGTYVSVTRVVGRNRKRKINITAGISTQLQKKNEARHLLDVMRRVVKLRPARCTCDYGRGWSDHAEHCQSIYKASCEDHLYD
jgi:hypothetical protein